MTKTLWFDMDGTLANLYGVEGWLEYLLVEDAYPYANAAVMHNFSVLARFLNRLQAQGWKLGIISWTSKSGSEAFNQRVEEIKREWLNRHLPSVEWDEIRIVRYGTNKYIECGGGILFDDEERNRDAWQDESYTPDQIMEILKKLAQGA